MIRIIRSQLNVEDDRQMVFIDVDLFDQGIYDPPVCGLRIQPVDPVQECLKTQPQFFPGKGLLTLFLPGLQVFKPGQLSLDFGELADQARIAGIRYDLDQVVPLPAQLGQTVVRNAKFLLWRVFLINVVE